MPFLTSLLPVQNQNLTAAYLEALTSAPAGALLTTPKVKLYTAGPAPITPLSVIGDFTEATFDGYVEASLTMAGPVFNLPSGDGSGKQGDADFVAGPAGPPETILGYYVEDALRGLVLAEQFQTPVPIAIAGDFISLDVVFPQANEVQIS